jgi:hypothetical protein
MRISQSFAHVPGDALLACNPAREPSFREPDFWPGITSGLPVRTKPPGGGRYA